MGFWNRMVNKVKTEADVARSVEVGTYTYGDLAGCRMVRLKVTLSCGVNDLEVFALLRLSQAFDADEKRDLIRTFMQAPLHQVLSAMETLRAELREMQQLARESQRVMYVQEQRVLAEWAVVETTFHY